MKVLAAALSVLMILSCAYAEDAAQPHVATLEEMKSVTHRLRNKEERGGYVYTGWNSCVAVDMTEFGLKGKRYLLTAAHCVLNSNGQPYADLDVEVDGKFVHATVIKSDEDLDFALISVEDDVPAVAKLGRSSTVQVGDDLTAVGGPMGQPLQATSGRVTSKRFFHCEIRSSMNIKHGNSGGAVFNSSGEVVAIVLSFDMEHGGDEKKGGPGKFAPEDCFRRFLEQPEFSAP